MAPLDKLSDEELLARLQTGDQAAFTAIYDRYFELLYWHAVKMLKDEDEAEDLIHELFLKLWTRSAGLHIKGTLAAYLYRAVKNGVIDSLQHAKLKQLHLDSLQEFISAGQAGTEEAIAEAELAREIEKEISRLPARMREVFELSRKTGLSHKEIAAELGISDKTVKKQISNAIHVLRVKFNALLFSILL